MIDYPIRVRNVLRWNDSDEAFLFNPQNGIFLSTTKLFNDLLAVCEQMDRAQLVAHLSASYLQDDVLSLLAWLDRGNDQLMLFETSAGDGLFCFTEEMVEQGLVDTLTLSLTHGCNLRCDYCFGALEYMQDTARMSAATAQAAIDFLFSEAVDKKHCRIIYTGGEPLLNWPVLEATTLYAETKARQYGLELTFWVKTNGTLISDQVLDFIDQHDFRVQISLDGQQPDHDRARHYSGGGGSFEDTLDALQRLVQRRGSHNLQIRATVTRQNVGRLKENLLFMAGLGAENVSAGPVMAPPQSAYELTQEALDQYHQAVRDVVAGLASDPHSPENKKLLQVLGYDGLGAEQLNPRDRYGCGAGLWHLAVDADGTILPCYRLAGRDEYDMGSVWQIDLPRIRKVQKKVLPIYNRDHKARCQRCWGQLICRRVCVAPELFDSGTEYERCNELVHILEELVQATVKDPAVRHSLLCL